MDRENSARPPSTRAPSAVPIPRTAALMSAASRPLTQQGLSGLRPTQTAGGRRIYRDKRYYISQIQAQTNLIREEIVRLKKETEENRMKALNINELRRTAQNCARKIEENQELLGTYNTVLEMHLSKTKEQELIAETEQIKKDNEKKLKELDNLFNEKLKLQDRMAQFTKKLEESDRAMNEMVDQLPPEEKEKYHEMVKENSEFLKKIESVQAKIKEQKEKSEHLKAIVSQSEEKQEIFQLLQTQQRLEAQKAELTAFIKNTLTPDQQREALLQQVKQDKADIEVLQKMKVKLEEEAKFKSEKLAELERELDGKDNARLKKHKELRERGEHMDAFIASFDEKSTTVKNKIDSARSQIVFALEHMADGLAELDLEEFGKIQIDSGDQTLEAWNQRCAAIAAQRDKLKAFQVRYEAELEKLKKKKDEMLAAIEDMKDVDRKKEEFHQEKNNLEEEYEALRAKLETTQAAVVEAQRKNSEILKKLEENPSYHKVIKLEKEIENLENRYRELDDVLQSEKSNKVVEELTNSVDELLRKRNEQLIASLKNKKHV
ncbi:hypothetical protein Trydic_g9580 [Trypoxylus dichotomus]